MENYSQLTSEQRYQIYALRKKAHTMEEIGRVIGVHKSTVSRELLRNEGSRGYRPKQAHQLAVQRRDEKVRFGIKETTWQRIEQLLREDWSPEQVCLWLREAGEPSASHESIYQYIYWDKSCDGDLHTYLRCKKQRRKPYGSYDRRGKMLNQVSIEERPEIVEERSREGDWELDTIIGKNNKQAIVTMNERVHRLIYLYKVETKDAESVAQAIIRTLSATGLPVLTLTADNGREFAKHETIAQELNADFYFAHPYSSWERGANENGNGLIRQYFPKGSDFSSITDIDLQRVERKLNNRPRKSLDMKTPNQVAFGKTPTVALGI